MSETLSNKDEMWQGKKKIQVSSKIQSHSRHLLQDQNTTSIARCLECILVGVTNFLFLTNFEKKRHSNRDFVFKLELLNYSPDPVQRPAPST